jgi:hypothetical protein
MERRKLTREFKLEAVRLIKDRGVSYVQARSRKAFGATAAHSTRRWHRPCDTKVDPNLGGSYADTGGLRHVRRFT